MSDSLLVKFLSHPEQSSSSFSLSYNHSTRSQNFSSTYSSTRLLLLVVVSLLLLEGCAGRISHYDKLSASLGQGNSEKAAEIIAKAESDYGSKSRLLYLMDRGMTLHLVGQYNESTKYLEQADELLEDLYTRSLRNEALSLILNDSKRVFRGDPYEQVMINVVNALNYARLGVLDEALVEARRVDHRLNVLSDSVDEEDYQEDPFARYLTGVLYEANGDESNAFVAYRKAYEAYLKAQPWSEVPIPECVKRDLLRITHRLNLSNEHAAYQEAFPEISWESASNDQGEIIVVSYHGRAPQLQDRFIDVPISLEALALVLQTKQFGTRRRQRANGVEPILYGLQGDIVRIALPRVVSKKTRVNRGHIQVLREGSQKKYRTELMSSVTASAKKNLNDRLVSTTIRAVARAAFKISSAEGISYGAGAAAKDEKTSQLIQGIVSALLKIAAIATEEADKRSWRTLPDEIHVSRISVSPGSMTLTYQAEGRHGQAIGTQSEFPITVGPGETQFVTVYKVE